MAFADLSRTLLPEELTRVQAKIPESEPGVRQDVVVIAGAYGRSTELNDFLRGNGFKVVGTGNFTPMESGFLSRRQYHFRSWARNGFVQLDETIFIRPGLRQDLLNWTLRSSMGKDSAKFKLVEHEILGNGGKVLSANHHLVVPETGLGQEDLALIKKAGDFEIITMPYPQYDEFMGWRMSDTVLSFEKTRLGQGKEIMNLDSAYNAWSLRTHDPHIEGYQSDLDLFMSLVEDKSGQAILLVDEIYNAIYPESVERAAKKLGVKLVDCVENAFLACNFFRAKDLAIVSSEARQMKKWLEDEVVGPGHVVDFPAKWVADIRYGSGFHCLFNEIDLSVLK